VVTEALLYAVYDRGCLRTKHWAEHLKLRRIWRTLRNVIWSFKMCPSTNKFGLQCVCGYVGGIVTSEMRTELHTGGLQRPDDVRELCDSRVITCLQLCSAELLATRYTRRGNLPLNSKYLIWNCSHFVSQYSDRDCSYATTWYSSLISLNSA
jgi:hypothetical protein